jgi:hypothetical protein
MVGTASGKSFPQRDICSSCSKPRQTTKTEKGQNLVAVNRFIFMAVASKEMTSEQALEYRERQIARIESEEQTS